MTLAYDINWIRYDFIDHCWQKDEKESGFVFEYFDIVFYLINWVFQF